ncbi:MAG: hypothetical protein ACRD3B_11970 [Candidatus Sulfotelmatobacter sp.]
MKYMNFLLAVALFAMVTSFSAFAGSKTEHSVNIGDPVSVGSTQLKAGNYRLEWDGSGPAVQVNFVRDGKTVATLPATLKMDNPNVTRDEVLTDNTGSNGAKLVEIDFNHQKESLTFGQSGM